MPEALCFDAFGTLFDTDSPVVAMREQADAPAAVVDEVIALWRHKQLQYTYLLALMDDYRPFDTVTRLAMDYAIDYYDLGLAEAQRDAVADTYDALEPFGDTVESLRRLAETDLTLAILSNGAPHTLEALAANAGIDGALDAIVSADEVGTYKPDPAVYENASSRLDVPLDECWLVSANAWDAHGAAAAGMGVVRIDRSNEPPERVGGDPDLVLDSLAALAEEFA